MVFFARKLVSALPTQTCRRIKLDTRDEATQKQGVMLPGVSSAKKKNGSTYYRSSITYRRKHISLGSFPTEVLAHQAYQEASDILYDVSITLDDLLFSDHVLALEKKISLVNFRDHHIYFKTPIYLRNKYFLYFLSPSDELKFDLDDLFYYSEHKIMRRKGHLFVNDFGMRVNIHSRYGIRNYGVAGKDYRFVNGDPTDFRYSNILVINRYIGVSRIEKKNRVSFKTQLHIDGYHTIGYYPTEDMAAIAYNKAVDLAKKHGISKNFMTNYILDYSPRQYAEEYTKIKISERFLNYLCQQDKIE